ncbi:MAG: ABC transporter substrate-binding protein, partial [Comamonadaceae bacterium]|nr:ABC transporter substrate-binding protein [Comamonadaceae bacterium]
PGMSQAELVKTVERYRALQLWKTTTLVEERAMEALQDMLVASGQLDKAKRVKYADLVDPGFAKRAK